VVTAVKDGKSVDTSMGLTPTGGAIMGTRCGDLDPGVLVYLLREKNFDAARLEPSSIITPASSEFPESIATCGACMKPHRPTPTPDWQFRCSVTRFANMWRA
jgi:hypothetical protein